MVKAIKILNPGWFTTVQDHGRRSFQHMGVPVSGVLDAYSATMAGLLAGNGPHAPVLEITVMGPTFEVLREMDIALTGAEMDICVNNAPCPQWESIRVIPGDKVMVGAASKGCRGYLALGGAIAVEEIMGSAATYVGGKTGGFQGRPLKKDDILETGDAPALARPRKLPQELIPDLDAPKILHAVPGPQDDFFETDILFNTPYTVTEKADRMGYRLSGTPLPMRRGKPASIVSEPVIPGAVQVPADQQPIILLGEQTVGGYAKIATVISTDLPRVAQALPGDTLEFKKVSLLQAHDRLKAHKEKIQRACDAFGI